MTMIGWKVEHEYARSVAPFAKHALVAAESAGPFCALQDLTGPVAPGERLDV